MGYNGTALQTLAELLQAIGHPHGSVLELGAQDINPGVSPADILACASAIHPNDPASARHASDQYDPTRSTPVSALFEGSPFRYRCIDLMPGPMTLQIDLNSYRVPWRHRGTFDVITNFGTSEHVTDQVNAFRAMHDFAKVGARIFHAVPFAGYFNHGLYNYHPAFFVFLANANGYEIEAMGLSGPHQPFTLPNIKGLHGTSHWETIQQSGMLAVKLRKIRSGRFCIFTDYDQSTMGRLPLPPPWDEMIRERYDLRVRASSETLAKS